MTQSGHEGIDAGYKGEKGGRLCRACETRIKPRDSQDFLVDDITAFDMPQIAQSL